MYSSLPSPLEKNNSYLFFLHGGMGRKKGEEEFDKEPVDGRGMTRDGPCVGPAACPFPIVTTRERERTAGW